MAPVGPVAYLRGAAGGQRRVKRRLKGTRTVENLSSLRRLSLCTRCISCQRQVFVLLVSNYDNVSTKVWYPLKS